MLASFGSVLACTSKSAARRVQPSLLCKTFAASPTARRFGALADTSAVMRDVATQEMRDVATQQALEVASGPPDVKHFRSHKRASIVPQIPVDDAESHMPHTVWDDSALKAVEITHTEPPSAVDRAAHWAVHALRTGFDILSGYKWGKYMGTLDERAWLKRVIFLETVAGVPGMVGGMVRHLHSLRLMRRDLGWIHTLLAEAENERMHLMIAMTLRKPGPVFRGMVVASQGIFFWSFGLAYLVSPRFCHRFVGYLEEEAVKTYTHLLEEMDAGNLPMFASATAPPIALQYYGLPSTASLREVFACIRADESHHRDVNHCFAGMKPDEANPFPPGY